jgi:hypothetical protein
VDVSIVNWMKLPGAAPRTRLLDGSKVASIDPSLRSGDEARPKRLRANSGVAFQGMLPGANYLADSRAAERLLAKNARYTAVIRPYLSGDDIANEPTQQPSRYIVDFGIRELEDAMQYEDAIRLVELQARHARETSRSYSRNPRWWQFLWPRPVFREASRDLPRFIAGTATAKRIFFCWCEPGVCASNSTNMFAVDGDYEMGVLTSSIHFEWARRQSSTLEDRIRYTPTSAFETFPFPTLERDLVAAAGVEVHRRRREICVERDIGLTKLYNQMDDGAWTGLRDLHRELDEAVAEAYGWPRGVAHDAEETNRRLLELNSAIAAGEVEYDPFARLRKTS